MRPNRRILIPRELRLRLIHQRIAIDHITRQFNIVVCELADLSIVHAEDFSFFAGAETQAGDEVHDEEDDAGAAEGVGEARDGVGELVGELDPVAVEPAALDDGEAVEVRYVVARVLLVLADW